MGQSTARRLALPAGAPLPSCRWGPYREGVVKRSAVGQGSWLDVGLDRDAHIPQVGCCLGLLTLRGVQVTMYNVLQAGCPG